MNKKYKLISNKLAFTFLGTMLLCGAAQASSSLTIKNDDTAEVNVSIEPGDGKLVGNDKDSIRLILKPGEEKTIKVNKDQLGQETFSATGKVTIPSLYNKCGPLVMDNNYKIIFVGSKTGGTICVSQPL